MNETQVLRTFLLIAIGISIGLAFVTAGGSLPFTNSLWGNNLAGLSQNQGLISEQERDIKELKDMLEKQSREKKEEIERLRSDLEELQKSLIKSPSSVNPSISDSEPAAEKQNSEPPPLLLKNDELVQSKPPAFEWNEEDQMVAFKQFVANGGLPPRKTHDISSERMPEVFRERGLLDRRLSFTCDYSQMNETALHYLLPDMKKWAGTIDAKDYNQIRYSSKHKTAYSPHIPKTGGSTTLSIEDKTGDWVRTNWHKISPAVLEEISKEYLVFTWIRDPVDKFLSSYDQWDSFYRMGWVDSFISKWRLKYFNASDDLCPRGFSDKMDRIEAFAKDIETQGFFEWHIHPQSTNFVGKPLYIVGGGAIFEHISFLGYTEDQNYNIKKIMPDLPEGEYSIHMQHSHNDEDCVKSLSCCDSLEFRGCYVNNHKKGYDIPPITDEDVIIERECEAEVAESPRLIPLIRRACRLYAMDYWCLPFKMPDVCSDIWDIMLKG